MYRYVALARAVDERMWILNRAGRIPFVISGQGHEGAQVGMAWAFERGHDWIAPFYRSIATCLTFGMTPRDIMTAQYATASDPSSGGRQMPGHYGSREHNLVSVSSPVATQLLHAVGIALAAKIRKTGQVAMASMGEGSSNQGDVHEGLNFAAIHKLPFIFVVENNGYAISVPAAMQVSVANVADRASGYGMPGVVVDGSDVLACYVAARDAVARARAGDGPTLIEAKVTRLTAHSSDDQQTKYRAAEELAAERELDALPLFRTRLRDAGVLTDEIEERAARGDRGGRRGRHRLRRGRGRSGSCDGDAPRLRRRSRGGRLMPLRTFIDAIRETLVDEMRRDPSMIVLGEDVGKKGGVFLATDGLWAEFGDDRVIDTPLTESMIVGASIGAAVNGLRPGRRDPVRRLHLPGLQPDRVRGGAHALPLEQRLRRADDDPGPVRRRRPRGALSLAVASRRSSPTSRGSRSSSRRPRTTRAACCAPRSATTTRSSSSSTRRCTARSAATSPTRTTSCRWAAAKVTHPGSQVTVVAYGLMAHYALEAADRVAEEGISVEVIDLRTLRPLDRDTLLDSVRKTGKCLDRLRGQQVRRVRRGGGGHRRRGGVRLPRWPGDPGRRARGAGRAVQPRPRGLVHGQPGEDRRRHPQAGRVLTRGRSFRADQGRQAPPSTRVPSSTINATASSRVIRRPRS